LIILVFTIAFFIVDQYWISFLCLALLYLLPKHDSLKKFSLKKDGIETEYQVPEEKIKENIKENKEKITRNKITHFKQVEKRVLSSVFKNIGGEIKERIHYMYTYSDHSPRFMYTPDATVKKGDEIIFIEIKYITNPKLTKIIAGKAIDQLEFVLDKFGPSTGKESLRAKLILASENNLDIKSIKTPGNIEVEFFKL